MPDPIDPKDQPAGDQPKPITEEDVGKIVNAAVTSQLNRTVPKLLGEAINGLGLDTKIAEALAKYAPQPKPEGEPKPGTKDALETQLKALAEKLEASEKRAIAAEQQRAEVEQQSKFNAAKNALRNGLAPKVRAEVLEDVVDLLADTRKRLKLSDDGKPLLTVKRAPYKGAPEQDEDLSLEEALPVLLSSKEISPYLPAPGGQQGSGTNRTPMRSAPHVVSDGGEGDKLRAWEEDMRKKGIDPDALGF